MNALYLVIWMAVGGYVYGKRRGKAKQYALASIPIAIATYIALVAAVGVLT